MILLGPAPGERRTFAFNARRQGGAVRGRFNGNNRATDPDTRFSGPLTCLSFGKGQQAWFAGVIESSNLPGLVGTEWGWRAVDGEPDEVTRGAQITGSGIWADADQFCSEQPDEDDHPRLDLRALVSGNVVIRGGL